MSPIGVIGLCAQDGHGDIATYSPASLTGVPMVASTLTADPLEDVARAGGAGYAAGVLKASAGVPVLLDSGVRSGVDALKALATGATA